MCVYVYIIYKCIVYIVDVLALKKAHCNLLFLLKTWYSHSLFSICGIYSSVYATAMLSDEHRRTRPQCGNRWIIQYLSALSLYKLPTQSLQ